jgi:hypothetical protein
LRRYNPVLEKNIVYGAGGRKTVKLGDKVGRCRLNR